MTETRRVDRTRLDPDQVLALLRHTGLTGHGGGGFPTATKIAAARGRRPELIVNACDGEPLVHKDSTLLGHRPLLVADGIAILQAVLRPRRTLVAVHGDGAAFPAASAMIAAGGLTAEILTVPARYVASEASALANLARGGDARPVFHDQPLTAGMSGRRPGAAGRPVLVLNAETVARVAATVLRGTGTPTRLLSLAGDLQRPAVIESPLATSVGDLVLGAGPTVPPRAVLVGGYGGRWHRWSDLAGRSIGDLAGGLGAGLIMVDAQGCPLARVTGIVDYLAAESAGQCGPCMFGLPALATDWRALADPGQVAAAEQRLRHRLPVVAGRGACHHPDGAVTMIASALAVFAEEIAAHRAGRCAVRAVLAGRR